ncbi:hypothetical protein EVAR_97915_1 [Eumeta japonica]|uniref:Uncharacterized protein n=1 Tax=Eumeta variegata TaxID=151549 RepID=A0A4C1SX06_EUMVA|nr:hypothetical protein EVAR_97915_1 [Eumeta japonica]
MKWKLLSGMFGWTSARPHDRPSFPLLFQCVMPFAVVAVSAAQYVLAPLTSVVADATATLRANDLISSPRYGTDDGPPRDIFSCHQRMKILLWRHIIHQSLF